MIEQAVAEGTEHLPIELSLLMTLSIIREYRFSNFAFSSCFAKQPHL